MFATPIQVIAAVLTVVLTVLIFLRPAPGARQVAVANVVAYLATPVVQNRVDYVSPQWGVLGVDLALLAVLTWVLVRERAPWLQLTWGAMALTVLMHFAKALDPTLFARGYIGALYVIYFVFLAGLASSLVPAARRPSKPVAQEPT